MRIGMTVGAICFAPLPGSLLRKELDLTNDQN